jgi:exopolysaccharide production protein ExoQ
VSVIEAPIEPVSVRSTSRYALIYTAALWLYLFLLSKVALTPHESMGLVIPLQREDPFMIGYWMWFARASLVLLLLSHAGALARSVTRYPVAFLLPAIWMVSTLLTAQLFNLSATIDIAIVSLAPIIFVERIGPLKVIDNLWWFLGIVAVASTLLSLSGSNLGVMMQSYFNGAWRGIFYHKNSFGYMLALLAIVSIFARRTQTMPAVLRLAMVVVVVVGIVGSDSVGSGLAAFFAVAISWFLWQVRTVRPPVLAGALVAFSLAAVLAFAAFLPMILDVLGRDVTLTGRTRVWSTVLPHSLSIFGLGAGAASLPVIVDEISRGLGYAYASIDNAYLILAVEFGWLAAIAYCTWLATLALRKPHNGSQEIGHLLLPAIAIFCATLAVVEKAGGPFAYMPFAVLMMAYVAERRSSRPRALETAAKQQPLGQSAFHASHPQLGVEGEAGARMPPSARVLLRRRR